MNLSNISLMDIIPENMRHDRTIKGFAHAWDYLQAQINAALRYVSLFKNLEALNSYQLDQVAAAMRIPWYDTSFTDQQKIDTIRHYELNCFELGTTGAVKRVAEDIFKDATIFEWFEYGGRPFHFKISVDAQESEDLMDRVARVIRSAKTAKAQLDGVENSSVINAEEYVTSYVFVLYKKIIVLAGSTEITKKMSVDGHTSYDADAYNILKKIVIPTNDDQRYLKITVESSEFIANSYARKTKLIIPAE